MKRSEFDALVKCGTLLLDGAMGSNLRRMGMPTGVCTELWALENPDVVLDLQRAYVDAGSQILYAPTFSANRIGLEMHGLQDRLVEINAGLIALSKRAADGRAWVAGDLTTTGKALEPRGEMTFQKLHEVYKEQIKVIVEAGADLLVVETMLGIDETATALEAAQAVCDLPVMCSLTVEADGHLYYDGTVEEAVENLQELGAAAVGVNCSVGPDALENVIQNMKAVTKVPILAKPNAGMPQMDDKGFAHYNMTPETFAEAVKRLVDCGACIVGGCCGTDPTYIRRMAELL